MTNYILKKTVLGGACEHTEVGSKIVNGGPHPDLNIAYSYLAEAYHDYYQDCGCEAEVFEIEANQNS